MDKGTYNGCKYKVSLFWGDDNNNDKMKEKKDYKDDHLITLFPEIKCPLKLTFPWNGQRPL